MVVESDFGSRQEPTGHVSGLARMDSGRQKPRLVPSISRAVETNAQYRERMLRQIGSLPNPGSAKLVTFPIKHPVVQLPRRPRR